MRRLRFVLVMIALAGCAAPTQPTPSAQPTLTRAPTPSATVEPSATPATPSPSAASTPTPTAASSSALKFALLTKQFLGALTFLANAGDGSGLLYAVEQVGKIQILNPDGTIGAAPFLDISQRIAAGGERGLLGLAFHPDYADNGRFYVDYTDVNGNTVVSEFLRTDALTADPGSERVLFTVDQPFPNHNGGMVAFGPDGALYVGMGDGGSGGDPQGNGQNPATLLAKLVRVDVDAAPGRAAEPQIWDSGLRNPWRFSFDRQTGDLWIGDVGQGAHEEIDAEPAGTGGRNYGWNIMEGKACFAVAVCDQTGLTLPVASYSHGGDNCSVTGGYVYRGTLMPNFVGTYFYADYCSGNIWGLDAAAALGGDEVTPRRLADSNINISAFGEDEAGELYIVDHGGRVLTIREP